eukprot:TRINITY_DN13665_c0_g1_i1.p1 TRINITY_DN13665_c0_g1~~TRINITY_DN13665_c0_g1_i1.p1  ORF type:complete len:390 (+),score=49.84 TRINITY_DN13665_c0_g1_i1:165-1334(+)
MLEHVDMAEVWSDTAQSWIPITGWALHKLGRVERETQIMIRFSLSVNGESLRCQKLLPLSSSSLRGLPRQNFQSQQTHQLTDAPVSASLNTCVSSQCEECDPEVACLDAFGNTYYADNEDGTQDCMICLTEGANWICRPCGHLVYCDACYGHKEPPWDRQCPNCKQEVTSFTEVNRRNAVEREQNRLQNDSGRRAGNHWPAQSDSIYERQQESRCSDDSLFALQLQRELWMEEQHGMMRASQREDHGSQEQRDYLYALQLQNDWLQEQHDPVYTRQMEDREPERQRQRPQLERNRQPSILLDRTDLEEFRSHQIVECLRRVTMRESESLQSDQVALFGPGTRLEIIRRSGNRLYVTWRTDDCWHDHERVERGWISIVSWGGAQLVRALD